MNTHTNCFYNPETNELVTNVKYATRIGFRNIGSRKLAEAMTSVTPEERIEVWNAYINDDVYGIDLNKLKSKTKHKLKKLGITSWWGNQIKSEGEELLKKINNKNL